MKTFFQFQKWWYLKGREIIIILLYFIIPFLALAAYFSGFTTMLALTGVILFFIGAIQIPDVSDFKRDRDYQEWLVIQKLKGKE